MPAWAAGAWKRWLYFGRKWSSTALASAEGLRPRQAQSDHQPRLAGAEEAFDAPFRMRGAGGDRGDPEFSQQATKLRRLLLLG